MGPDHFMTNGIGTVPVGEQSSAASAGYDLDTPAMREALKFLYPALKKAVEHQRKAWFRGSGTPPGNIRVEWTTGIDTAQTLVTEIERMMAEES